MKQEITSQKKLFNVKKECDSEGQETFAFILFYYFEQVFVAMFVYFFFCCNVRLFFLSLINY